jgi:hypothetical protein
MTSGGDTVSEIKNKFTGTIIQKQFFMDSIVMFSYLENMHATIQYRSLIFPVLIHTPWTAIISSLFSCVFIHFPIHIIVIAN